MKERQEKIKQQILKILPCKMRMYFVRNVDFEKLQEIRIRINKPVLLKENGKEKKVVAEQKIYEASASDMKECVEYISKYSRYAYEHEMSQGFLTVEGGHRIGFAGKIIRDGMKIRHMKDITSLNIRVAHEKKGCADELIQYLVKNGRIMHTLIISPPGLGKTTLLRDLIRQVSNGTRWNEGCSVGVVDERMELGSVYQGEIQNDLGIRSDVLSGCTKEEGMMMLVRSMAPEVIAVDEIGREEEIPAILYAMCSGCKFLATAHGDDLMQLKEKPFFKEMIQGKYFERFIVLSGIPGQNQEVRIYDTKEHCLNMQE